MKRDQTNVRRRVKEAPAGAARADRTATAKTKISARTHTSAGTRRRGAIDAKRRIAWHLYQARHDQSEALA